MLLCLSGWNKHVRLIMHPFISFPVPVRRKGRDYIWAHVLWAHALCRPAAGPVEMLCPGIYRLLPCFSRNEPDEQHLNRLDLWASVATVTTFMGSYPAKPDGSDGPELNAEPHSCWKREIKEEQATIFTVNHDFNTNNLYFGCVISKVVQKYQNLNLLSLHPEFRWAGMKKWFFHSYYLN